MAVHAIDAVALMAILMGGLLMSCSREVSDVLFARTPLGIHLRRTHLQMLCAAAGVAALALSVLGLAVHNS